ncbi:hypothetical protein HaLaN_32946, partial [Haematococcus lacustris]
MPPKQTGSDKKAGTKHSRSLSDSDTGSTPAFKSQIQAPGCAGYLHFPWRQWQCCELLNMLPQ